MAVHRKANELVGEVMQALSIVAKKMGKDIPDGENNMCKDWKQKIV